MKGEHVMIKDYEIFSFNNEDNENVILLTTTEDLYFLEEKIYEELSVKNGENFSVLVDLFLRNGFSFNRFVTLNYKGKNNVKVSVKNPIDVSEKIKYKIRQYLRQNIDILNNSALSMRTIEFVKNN